MSKTVGNYLDNLKQAIDGLEDKSVSIVRYYQDDIMDIIREKQIFEKGIDGLGQALPHYQGNVFEGEGRGYPKLRSDSYNLFVSGNFFNNFMLTANGLSFKVTNETDYVKALFSNNAYKNLLIPTRQNQIEFERTVFKKELDQWLLSIL